MAAGRRHSVALRRNGTVVAVGNGRAGECNVDDWENVVAVAVGNVHSAANTGKAHTVGLRSDGTVLATGWNGDHQCELGEWRDVTAIAAGWRRTLGLLENGAVLATGRTAEGACDVQSWQDVVAISCGIGIRSVCVRTVQQWLSVTINVDSVPWRIGGTSPLSLPVMSIPSG